MISTSKLNELMKSLDMKESEYIQNYFKENLSELKVENERLNDLKKIFELIDYEKIIELFDKQFELFDNEFDIKGNYRIVEDYVPQYRRRFTRDLTELLFNRFLMMSLKDKKIDISLIYKYIEDVIEGYMNIKRSIVYLIGYRDQEINKLIEYKKELIEHGKAMRQNILDEKSEKLYRRIFEKRNNTIKNNKPIPVKNATRIVLREDNKQVTEEDVTKTYNAFKKFCKDHHIKSILDFERYILTIRSV